MKVNENSWKFTKIHQSAPGDSQKLTKVFLKVIKKTWGRKIIANFFSEF